MRKRFSMRARSGTLGRGPQKPKLSLLFGILSIVLGIWFAVFTIDLLFPFESWNPFEKKITIGQKTIQEWKYGGENSEGNLLFYNNFNVVTIPASQGRFDAEGEYILIHNHSADTLTIETRDDFIWKLLTYTVAFSTGILLFVTGFLMKGKTIWKRRTRPLRRNAVKTRMVHFKSRQAVPPAHFFIRTLKWKLRLWQWRSRRRP